MNEQPALTGDVAALRAALERIVNWSECLCEHDTEDCCANVADNHFHCPGCIAAKALAATGDHPTGIVEQLRAAARLLRCVRVLDCGAHYCRYCPARSPLWEHSPSCPYPESQRDYSEARKLADALDALIGSRPSHGPAGGWLPSLINEIARDIDFAIDVTEPRDVLLARFRDILTDFSGRLRILTVHETVESLRRGGWLSGEDAAHVKATLPAPPGIREGETE